MVTFGVTEPEVMVIVFELAVVVVTQLALLVRVTETWSLVVQLLLVNVLLLPPKAAPFSFHWYTGALPPLVGVAVNVTGVPAHAVVADAAMETEGVTAALVITTSFDV